MNLGVSYFGNKFPEHAQKDFEDILRHNCTYVIITFDENDLQFYAKTFKKLVDIAHRLGLKVYFAPWGVGGFFGGEAFSNFISLNIDARQILFNGKIAPAACINNIKFKKFMKQWTQSAIDTGADVIFWDEPHFYLDWWEYLKDDSWSCKCSSCKELFKLKYSYPMPNEITLDVKKFRRESIKDFLEDICNFSHRQNMKNALCFIPFDEEKAGTSDWDAIASIKHLDIVGTDPYWISANKKLKEYINLFVNRIIEITKKYNKEGQIWVQGFNIPHGREEEISKAIELIADRGIKNIACWSYKGTGHMSYGASDRPDIVWKIIGREYGKLK